MGMGMEMEMGSVQDDTSDNQLIARWRSRARSPMSIPGVVVAIDSIGVLIRSSGEWMLAVASTLKHVLIDAVELEQLLGAGHVAAALGFLARVVAATATRCHVLLRRVDDPARAVGAGDAGQPGELLDVGATELARPSASRA